MKKQYIQLTSDERVYIECRTIFNNITDYFAAIRKSKKENIRGIRFVLLAKGEPTLRQDVFKLADEIFSYIF